jgi:hypothetical protein
MRNAEQMRPMYCDLFSPVSPHVHIDFVGPPPGYGRSVTDFWVWGAYRAQLRCPDDVSDDMYERGVAGDALNLNSTGYPYHSRYGDLPLQEKIPTAEPGIEPGTSWLVVRSSDHQATRLVDLVWMLLPIKPHVLHTIYYKHKI